MSVLTPRTGRLRVSGFVAIFTLLLSLVGVQAARAAVPTISSFTPTSGSAGIPVTITGSALTGATEVTFNAAAATFTVDTDTQITAYVPVRATTGPIALTTPGGSVTSSTDFTVEPIRRDITINRTKTVFTGGPFKHDYIVVYGAGSWDPEAGVVDIAGLIIHHLANGSVFARVPWVAKGVRSFVSYGATTGPPPLEGGQIVLRVQAFPPEGRPLRVTDFTVTCLLGTPPQGAEEGVTIASLGATKPIDEEGRFTLLEQV